MSDEKAIKVEPIFVAYPSVLPDLGICIEDGVNLLKGGRTPVQIKSWRQMDIPGRFIVDSVLKAIDGAPLVVADITRLNFNVTFEVGYALGKSKRVLLVSNSSLQPATKEINKLGIFDSLGSKSYTNKQELADAIRLATDLLPLTTSAIGRVREAPIYLLDTLYKTDASIRTKARIKKARIHFRSFDPAEQSRLSALEAFQAVANSVALVLHLLPQSASEHEMNNLHAAFLAGLGYGMGKEVLLLQSGEEPVPLDYRDLVSIYRHPEDIDAYISDLAPRVMEALQATSATSRARANSSLAQLNLGASAAENEFGTLGDYYLHTDQFAKASSGAVRLVVGRKGAGKSAMFFQVRDNVRTDRRAVVLDLKPEGHQLKRFKEMLLQFIGEGVQEHVAAAFWEYVLLLELCYKLLEKDRETHLRDHNLYERYSRLTDLYHQDEFASEGDFSERMLLLVQRISNDFRAKYAEAPANLRVNEVAALVYRHDVSGLKQELAAYLGLKRGAWILFDNIDKGWPTRGVQMVDIVILRGLLDATRKIERMFRQEEVSVHTIVFLRNDVYELLISDMPDRGKESRVSLDWTDTDLLKEMLRLRFVYSGADESNTMDELWHRVAVSHIEGERTLDYLLERSLMRPRNLLNLVMYCKSNAVNLRHQKIAVEDIQKAVLQYSSDIGYEIGLEVRDVFPNADDILYYFIGASPVLTLSDLYQRFEEARIPADQHKSLVEILLWFSFIGVHREEEEYQGTFSYSTFYDMKKLKRLASDLRDNSVRFVIHRAFWPFLEIPGIVR